MKRVRGIMRPGLPPVKVALPDLQHKSRSRLVRELHSAPQEEVMRGVIHLSRLSNFVTSAVVARHLDVRNLKAQDMFIVLRAMLSSNQGVEADELIEWYLKGSLRGLSEPDQLALAKLIFASGLPPDRRVVLLEQTRAKLRAADELTPLARKQFRYQEYRTRVANEDRVDTLKFAEVGKHEVAELRHQMPYFTFLRDRGYNDVIESALGKLIRTYGAKDAGVWVAALKYNATWVVMNHPELLAPPSAVANRLDVLELAHTNRLVDERLAALAEATIGYQVKKYLSLDIYARDKLLRALIRMERFDECGELIRRDATLPDTVLVAHKIRGMEYLKAEDYFAAKDAFQRVLEEDASDSFAGQGMRFSLARTGGTPKDVLAMRDRIGYGISSRGRAGRTARVGSDQIIAHLNAGEYREGLFAKRHAAHWRLLKGAYGDKFLNYEHIPLKGAATKHIFIMGDEGVSDEVRTAQYYDFIVKNFGRVSITCDPRFLPLFQSTWPTVQFLPVQRHRKGVAKPSAPLTDRISNFDLKLSNYLTEECRPVMDSADIITFGQNLFFNHFTGRIPRPNPGPYLKFQRADLPTTDKLRVGLQWRSGFVSTWRKFMYLDLEAFSPLLDVEGIEFWALQHQMSEQEESFCRANGIRIPSGVDLYDDFNAIASYSGTMDLMIGLSSLPIEMGCAVGTPAWMLGFSPENYFLRTTGGQNETDRLSLNSTVIAPQWIDFSSPVAECLKLCINEVKVRLEHLKVDRTVG